MTTIPCIACQERGSVGEFPCSLCNGNGTVDAFSKFGMTEAHFISMFQLIVNHVLSSNVFPSYEILECLDATEHAALTDTQKDGVLHILACGRVDLNEGKVGRVRLWNWFGAESTTVANLTALL